MKHDKDMGRGYKQFFQITLVIIWCSHSILWHVTPRGDLLAPANPPHNINTLIEGDTNRHIFQLGAVVLK